MDKKDFEKMKKVFLDIYGMSKVNTVEMEGFRTINQGLKIIQEINGW